MGVSNSENLFKFVLKNDYMKLILDIPNNQAEFFLELIKSLNFEIKIDKKESEIDIPEWHEPILEERLAKYETDTSGFVKWEDLKKSIEA